jgi:hypothetical protein
MGDIADNDKTKTPSGEAAAPDMTSDTTTEDRRSLDIGESGQFAPGGYYNQQGATKTDRIDLDEQVSSALDDKS